MAKQPIWTFVQFVTPPDVFAIDEWRESLSIARRTALDTFLNRISKMEHWSPTDIKGLKDSDGLTELRWTAEKVEHRLLGRYDGHKRYLLLLGCTHKGKVYTPPEAIKTARKRLKLIVDGEANRGEYSLVTGA